MTHGKSTLSRGNAPRSTKGDSEEATDEEGVLSVTRRQILQGATAFGILSTFVGKASAHVDGRGETGTVSINQPDAGKWHRVSLDHSYSNLVVIMKPASYNGVDPCHVRLRNVGGQTFEYKLEEWEYLDGGHTVENLHYIALDEGEYKSQINMEVGSVETDQDFTIGTSYHDNRPVVLTQPQTYRGGDPIVSRVNNISSNGSNTAFSVRVQEEGANGNHTKERIGYIAIQPINGYFYGVAIEADRTADLVTDEWSRIDFDRTYESPRFMADLQTFDGSDTAGLRYRNLTGTGVDVFVEEERSADNETNHTTESVGYMVTGGAKQILIRYYAEAGTVSAGQPDVGTWHQVSLLQDYTDPVVIMKPLSYNGSDPCHIRLRNVSGQTFEYKLEEWQHLDGSHTSESFHYIVMEEGKYGEYFGQPNMQAGSVETDQDFTIGISYHDNRPVVLTQPQTYRGGDPIVSRVRNVGTDGSSSQFAVRVQEEEAKGNHTKERIGYIAILPREDDFENSDTLMEARRTTNVVTDEWSRIDFDRTYRDPPHFMADLQTFDGSDTAGLRYRNLTGTGVDVFVEEERSADNETNHTTESVGYLAIQSL